MGIPRKNSSHYDTLIYIKRKRLLIFLLSAIVFCPCWFSAEGQTAMEKKLGYEKELESVDTDSLRMELCLKISSAAYIVSFPEAMKYAQQAVKIASQLSPKLQVKAEINLGRLLWEDGYYEGSITLYHKIRKLYRAAADKRMEGIACNGLGLNYFYMAEYDSALHYYQSAKNIFISVKDTAYLSLVIDHIGLVYDKMGDYRSATQLILESRKLQEDIPNFQIGAYPKNFVHEINSTQFHKQEIERNLRVLEHQQKNGTDYNVAITLHSISSSFEGLNQYDRAIEYLRKANEICQKNEARPFLADLGRIFEKAGQFDSAFFYYQKAVSFYKKYGTRIWLATTYEHLGNLEKLKKDYLRSLNYYSQAYAMENQMGNRLAEAHLKLCRAEVMWEQGNQSTAIEEANKSLILSKAIHSQEQERQCLAFLSKAHEQQLDFEKALHYRKEYQKVNASLSEGSIKLNMMQMQLQFETERKERQLKEYQQTALITEQNIKAKNLQILLAIVLFGIVLVLVILGFIRYRKNKKSSALLATKNKIIEKQNDDLHKQNKEKETLLHEIHHRVKNNLQIISSFINLKIRHVSLETQETLRQLNGRIFSLGLIHEKLYQEKFIQSIRLDAYLSELGHHLLGYTNLTDRPIRLELDIEPIEIDGERALSCGLICNELMTNSLKYAFPDSQDNRIIGLSVKKENDTIILQVKDNGSNPLRTPNEIKRSFGLRFVDQLAHKKLKGEWSLNTENGFQVMVKLKNNG